jgi:hypothetical protein
MVLHRFASGSASHTLRVCGAVVAYAFVLVTGTALLMAAFGAHDGARTGPSVQITATEAGVKAPDAFLLASRNIPNDKRGF